MALALSALTVAAASFAAKQDNDPVVMSVGPEKVTLSEFEYLYNKNSDQQAVKTSLEDYIDMFVDYKLKVVAAKDAGLDTAAAYLRDMDKYSLELARPYLRATEVDDSLVRVAYDHMKELVDVDHILIASNSKERGFEGQRRLADSIHDAIIAGADFGEMARKYSIDQGTAARGGKMGHIAGGLWPYTFEDLAFNTPVGQVSDVKRSKYGYHIVRVNGRKPNPGEVKARHILKSIDESDPASVERQKAVADSLLAVLRAGADFKKVAGENTDEPQGKMSGGELPWFTVGQMVQEFNDAAFALKPGEISEPVKTRFGWHLILCEDRRDIAPFDSVKSSLEGKVKADERGTLAVKRTLGKWMTNAGVKRDKAARDEFAQVCTLSGALTESAKKRLDESSTEAAKLGTESISLGDVVSTMRPMENSSLAETMEAFDRALESKIERAALDQYVASLPATEKDYRNLLNEYRDGMLLYEISNREVWDKANADSLGLQRYYEAHIGEYTWDKPHYKGFVIAATSDSIADAALAFLKAELPADCEAISSQMIRKQFGTNVKVERVLAAKGDNAVVDNLCFGGPAPKTNNRWKAYRTFAGKIIDTPENARDVKGQVSLGYQQQLEADWMRNLHKRYKVKVDRKAIKKAFAK